MVLGLSKRLLLERGDGGAIEMIGDPMQGAFTKLGPANTITSYQLAANDPAVHFQPSEG
jgi:hypothetical protein